MTPDFNTTIPNTPKINPADLDWLQCTVCNSHTFVNKILLKKFPALLSPTGQEELLPLDILMCDKCGEVPDLIKKAIPGGLPASIDGKLLS